MTGHPAGMDVHAEESNAALTQQLTPDEGKDYLADLQGLARELETAMKSVAIQELIPLQESIRGQQAACSRLAHLQCGRSSVLLRAKDPADTCVDSDLAFQIEEAIAAVLSLNQRYEALLRHSGETLRLLAGLFRSYQGPNQLASGLQATLQTWSCEV